MSDTVAQIAARAARGESFIVASDLQFLGRLTLNQYDSESISNPYGSYGSQYSQTSIYNPYSNYGSQYSSLSPNNPYTNTPPSIYLNGRLVGYLTKNKYFSQQALDPDNLSFFMRENNLLY